MTGNLNCTPGDWVSGWGRGLTGPRCAPTVWLDGHATYWPVSSGDTPVCWLLSTCESPDSLKDDAAMISAAKDMYAALSEIVEFIDATDAPGYDGNWHIEARAALAKARGESHE